MPAEEWFWITAIILVIFLTIIIGLIVESTDGSSSSGNLKQKTNLGRVGERCENLHCSPGSICSINSSNEQVCLAVSGSTCQNNIECLSGLCSNGVCVSNNSGTPIVPPSTETTIIYCWNGSSWISKYNLPQGLNPDRISSYGNELLAITKANNQVYLYSGTSWRSITSTFTSPGQLVDGVIANGNIYLVYMLSTGQTSIFQLINGSLTTISTPGACTGQHIIIKSINVSPTGQFYLVGTISGSPSILYTQPPGYSCFTTLGNADLASVNASGYAIGSQCSVVFGNTRFDNVCNLTSLTIDNTNIPWYISNLNIYQGRNVVYINNYISPRTQVYNSQDGICIYTPR